MGRLEEVNKIIRRFQSQKYDRKEIILQTHLQIIFFRFPPVIHLRNMFAHVFSASPPTKHALLLRIFFRFPGTRPDPPIET